MNVLISKQKTVFVDGRLSKPTKGDLEEVDWVTHNYMVISNVLEIHLLNEELQDSVIYQDTT